MQGQLLLSWFFIPINIQQVPLPLQGIYFCYYFWICTLTNLIFFPILCILYKYSHQKSKMILTKIKKKKNKEHAKIKSLTVHLLLFSFIILVTFHTIFASFYFALFQYFHDIWLKYTKFRNGRLVGGFAISSDGYFFYTFSVKIRLSISWKINQNVVCYS